MTISISYEKMFDQFGEEAFALIEWFQEVIMNNPEADIFGFS